MLWKFLLMWRGLVEHKELSRVTPPDCGLLCAGGLGSSLVTWLIKTTSGIILLAPGTWLALCSLNRVSECAQLLQREGDWGDDMGVLMCDTVHCMWVVYAPEWMGGIQAAASPSLFQLVWNVLASVVCRWQWSLIDSYFFSTNLQMGVLLCFDDRWLWSL